MKKRKKYRASVKRKIDAMHLGRIYYDKVEEKQKTLFGE